MKDVKKIDDFMNINFILSMWSIIFSLFLSILGAD